jgi:acetyl-CoA carboxylase carboxyltransferase component
VLRLKDDKDALKNKNIVDKIGTTTQPVLVVKAEKPAMDERIIRNPSKARNEQYDMMDIINRLVDNSEFEAYKDGYGQTIITGYAHRRLG